MKLTDKDMDKIGKVLLVIFCFLMLMFSIESNAQTYTVNKINDRYFFETDLLFRSSLNEFVIKEIYMDAKYGEENSNLGEKNNGDQIFSYFDVLLK